MSKGGLSVLSKLALIIAAPLALAAANTLQKVELSTASADGARIVMELSGAPVRKVFTLDNPDRVVVDIKSARLAPGLRLPKAAGPVHSIRSAAQPDKSLRVVIELTRKFDPQVSVAGSRLTIDLGAVPRQPAANAASPTVASPVAAAPVRAAHAPDDTGRDVIVAVDAGHGGTDPGASGASGTREKDVVLAIARALAQRIDQKPGMRAYLTRKEDRLIPLAERIALARAARADLFVSIHADAVDNRTVSGSSVYVLSQRGASSEAARLLAERENAVDLKGGISLSNRGDLAPVLMDLSQQTSIGYSMEAAQRVLSQLDRVGSIRKTQVQTANFVVLRLPDIPSMLVETAYISNPAEERKLRDPEHQAAIADAILAGVLEYFRTSPPDGTLFARQRENRGTGVSPIIAGATSP